MLIIYIFYLLAYTGNDGSGEQTFLEIMQEANAYTALLWGTMAAALTAVGFYFIQDKYQERIIFFNFKGYRNRMRRAFTRYNGKCGRGSEQVVETWDGDGEEKIHARVLMPYTEAMTAFLVGMEKIFAAMVVLTLAWASGAVIQAVGLSKHVYFCNFIFAIPST